MAKDRIDVPDGAQIVNGEPLQDISILRDPENALALIMKQGEIVKPAL